MNFLLFFSNLITINNIFFILLIQTHIFKKDYVVIKKRFIKNKKKEIFKIHLHYIREEKIRDIIK